MMITNWNKKRTGSVNWGYEKNINPDRWSTPIILLHLQSSWSSAILSWLWSSFEERNRYLNSISYRIERSIDISIRWSDKHSLTISCIVYGINSLKTLIRRVRFGPFIEDLQTILEHQLIYWSTNIYRSIVLDYIRIYYRY